MESRILSKCILALTQARWRTVFKIMCSRFLAKHSAFRRAANDFDHEQMFFRPMQATSVADRSKSVVDRSKRRRDVLLPCTRSDSLHPRGLLPLEVLRSVYSGSL